MSPRRTTAILLDSSAPGSLLTGTLRLADAARLGSLQGNVLFPHGRRSALHLFLRFAPDGAAARGYLARLGGAASSLISEIRARRRREEGGDAGDFVGVHLSAAGYRALGLEPPPERAFRRGMKGSALNDRHAEWDEGYRAEVHALLVLAHDDAESLRALALRLAPREGEAEPIAEEWGRELPGEREHFGFRDNISQPLFIDEEIEAARGEAGAGRLWDPATPLGVVLAPDPHAPGAFGSYLVYRKLQQDVTAFDAGVRALAGALGVDEALAGALVIGRFKDGTPLALADHQGLGPANDFDYRAERGERCPFASHVRRSNPRGELDGISETEDVVNRIARRSMPYGRPGDADVGMLFQCYQADIARQFELIQNNWLNYPHFPRNQVGADPLAGQANSWDPTPGQRWETAWRREGTAGVAFRFAESVRCRGGEYFFAPSLDFLHTLEHA